jgi:acetoin utilization protein AcuB
MVVRTWMTREVAVIPPSMPIAEAAREMARRRVRRLPVVTPATPRPRLVGIVSLLDVTRAFPPGLSPTSVAAAEQGPREPVSGIMTREVLTVGPDTALEDAAVVLARRKIGALPVVSGDHLVGIITESDVFRAFLEVLGAGRGLRVMFALRPGEDVVRLVSDLAARHEMAVLSALTLDREGQRLGVVRLSGPRSEPFIETLWRSGHQVLSVQRGD